MNHQASNKYRGADRASGERGGRHKGSNLSADLLAWHQKLLRGDTEAPQAIGDELHEALTMWASLYDSEADAQAITDAVHSALIQYYRYPLSFEPKTGVPLGWFLAKAVKWHLLDWHRAQSRRSGHEQPMEEAVLENVAAADAPPDAAMTQAETQQRCLEKLDEVRALLSSRDRAAFDLTLKGTASVADLAAALEVPDLSPAEQGREVSLFRDRLRKTIARWKARLSRQRSEGSAEDSTRRPSAS